VSLIPGRTSNGKYGLNHYSPQKDLYNGPHQSFLENDLLALSKPAAWQQWSDIRSRFLDDSAHVASEVFTLACSDETVVLVTPCNPSLGGSNRNSPSTPFRRSPRPEYEAKIAEIQSKYIRIREGSWLHYDRALLVHVWRNATAANRFAQCWQRCWQVLFEHRVKGIHVPVSVLYCMQGILISATAMPPVYVDRVPPLAGIFRPFMNAELDLNNRSHRTPRPDPPKGNLLQHMIGQLFISLHITGDEAVLREYGDCNLYAGVDGRWYLLEIGPILAHSTPLLRGSRRIGCPAVRHEILRQMCLENSGHADYSYRGVHRYIVHVAIPKAVGNAVRLLPLGIPDSRKPETLIRDGFLPMMLHDHGVNIAYMYHVYEYCIRQAAQRSNLDQDDPDDGRPSPRKARRPKSANPQQEMMEFFQLLARTAQMEMLSRAVKHLLRLDCMCGFATADMKTSTVVRVDMVNRVARMCASRDMDFLLGHVLPMMREKFRCPDSFMVNWEVIPIGSLLKVISVTSGCEYGVTEGRFHAFAPFASKKFSLMAPLVVIDAMISNDEQRVHAEIGKLWSDANKVLSKAPNVDQQALLQTTPNNLLIYSHTHVAFLVRALAFSIISNSHKGMVAPHVALDFNAAKRGVSVHTLLQVMEMAAAFEFRYSGKVADLGELYRGAICELLAQAGSDPAKFRHDTSMLTIQLIHCGRLMRQEQHPCWTLRRSMEEYTRIPYVDFVFSAVHSQALRDVESSFDLFNEADVLDYFDGVVEFVGQSLKKWNRNSNAARYLHRVTTAMIGKKLMEASTPALRIATLSFSVNTTSFGAHDSRTLFTLYVMCLFSLTTTKKEDAQVRHATGNLRKVISKHQSLSPALQLSFGRTSAVQSLLCKVRSLIQEDCEATVLSKLNSAIAHAGSYLRAVVRLQAVGRGFLRRRFVSLKLSDPLGNVGLPQRSSTLAWFDGQMPLTLGQASALGISLDDDDKASDSSSTRTGSFVSSCQSSQPRPRFSQQQQQQAHPPVLEPEGSSSNPLMSSAGVLTPVKTSPPDPPKYGKVIRRKQALDCSRNSQVTASLSISGGEAPQAAVDRAAYYENQLPHPADNVQVPVAWDDSSTLADENCIGRTSGLAGSLEERGVKLEGDATTHELFLLCDKDRDGFVTVQQCVDVIGPFRLMPIDALRELFQSVTIKQRGTGLSIFSKPREVICINGFREALTRTGIIGKTV
jgi:hypothetical protein